MHVHQELVAFTEYKKTSEKKYYLFPEGGAPLEGGARWLGHPSFYGSLAPVWIRHCIDAHLSFHLS